MGLVIRKRIPINRNAHINLSKSGTSVTQRLGKRVTINSRGRISIRLAKGVYWRSGR